MYYNNLTYSNSNNVPFLRKVVISREIENFRQFDGNPDSLLKDFSARRHGTRAVDFLGCPLGVKQSYSSASESSVPAPSSVYRSAGIELTASCSSDDKELYHSSHSRVSSVKSDLLNDCP